MLLICHVASYNHSFKWSCDFMVTLPHITTRLNGRVTLWFAMFIGQRPCGSRDITDLICHVKLQDHLIKGSYDFMEGSSLLYVTIMPSFVTVAIVVVVEICCNGLVSYSYVTTC